MLICSAAFPGPEALVAEVVTFFTSSVVGMPLMSPVLVFSESPAGSAPVTA